MVSKKAAIQAVSKTSSAAAPATSASTRNADQSSVLRSAFAPSQFQLSLFASVIQGLDSQQLRIHDTTTGLLKCDHTVGSRSRINCLTWGNYGSLGAESYQPPSKKKRKISDQANGSTNQSDVVVALGTSTSEIQFLSPVEGTIVGRLRDGHTQGIHDFKFVNDGTSSLGWSLGGDGKMIQWNIRSETIVKILDVPDPSVKMLLPMPPSLLCASHTAYLMDPNIPGRSQSFPGFIAPIHTLITAPAIYPKYPSTLLAAADAAPLVTLFDMASSSIITSFQCLDAVKSLAISTYPTVSTTETRNPQALAAITENSEIKIFPSPFDLEETAKPKATTSLKSAAKSKSRHAVATLSFFMKGKSTKSVSVLGACFDGNDLVVAWTDGGVHLNFERLPWREESSGGLLFTGQEKITVKSSAGLGASNMNGVKEMGRSHVDESHTIVARGGDTDDITMADEVPEIIDISSAEEEDDDDDSDAEQDFDTKTVPEQSKMDLTSGEATMNGDHTMKDADSDTVHNVEETEEPTFGDLIRANVPEIVDVAGAFPDPSKQALAPLSEGRLKLPPGMSLGTVLTQSLRTNDVKLLESCFHVRDLNIIRATIERLDSALATNLLQKLAERLHSRPGRAGSLMVWVQWTLIAHGGYLAGQPEVISKLTSLHRVVKERANSLQSLLSLKGKLDMLEAQMNLRKSMQSRFKTGDAENPDDEEGVVYVEGQDESSSDEDEKDDGVTLAPRKVKIRHGGPPDTGEESSGSDNEMDDDLEDIDETQSSEGSDNGSGESGLVDDEASEAENDSDDDDSHGEVDHDDVDTSDEDEESEIGEATQKSARTKLTNGVSKKK
ncbi:Small subunit (SSU) processome component [Ptychographa xylographoides]|nr:Small subunit (SSU) processome component [Ptychographa xylographoides]